MAYRLQNLKSAAVGRTCFLEVLNSPLKEDTENNFFGHWKKRKINFVYTDKYVVLKAIASFHCSFYKSERRGYLGKSAGLMITFLSL